jgi:hypothetical protein
VELGEGAAFERAGCGGLTGFLSPDRVGMVGKRLRSGFGRVGLVAWQSAEVTRAT